jgi:ribosomal protein S1
VVLDFDDEKKRISLGLKQLTPHPWDVLPETISEGAVVTGKVVNIEDYGAFLEIFRVWKVWCTYPKLPGPIRRSMQKSSLS